MDSEDEDIIKENKDDAAYMKYADEEEIDEFFSAKIALTNSDVANLLMQHGIHIEECELSDLYHHGFSNLKMDRWYLVFCPEHERNPSHWISVLVTMDEESSGEPIVLVFDSFGRHIEDVFKEHGYKEDMLDEESFITVTGNYQGAISQVCGYYQCMFAYLYANVKQHIEVFQSILNLLLIEVEEKTTRSDDIGLITFNNDKITTYVFSKAFDTSNLSPIINKILQVRHRLTN